MENRESLVNSTVHVVNIDIEDNSEDAKIGAFLITDLCTMLTKSDDIDNDLKEVLHECEESQIGQYSF